MSYTTHSQNSLYSKATILPLENQISLSFDHVVFIAITGVPRTWNQRARLRPTLVLRVRRVIPGAPPMETGSGQINGAGIQ